jgi:hypothetical protein
MHVWNEAAREKWDSEHHKVTLSNASAGSKPWNLIVFNTPMTIDIYLSETYSPLTK